MSLHRETAIRLKPLQQWVCDGCGELIQEPAHGYLEWLQEDHKAHGFRVVHHAPRSPRRSGGGSCYRYTNHFGRSDLDLKTFLGPTGVPVLLRFLDPGPYHVPEYVGPEVRDVREWVELFRRLHTPYYEEAYLYWNRADQDGYFDGANEVWLYLPDTLRHLIERFGDGPQE
jgi:hypothetical protein